MTAKDQIGHKMGFVSEPFAITGPPVADPLEGGITIENQTVSVGTPIRAAWWAKSGTLPYTALVTWEVYFQHEGKETLPGGDEKGLIPFIPTRPCTGHAEVIITDSVGRSRGYISLGFEAIDGPVPLYGDANDDQAVDILDLVTIIDYLVSGTLCPSMDLADANRDTAVDILDLVGIIDLIVGQ